MSEMVKYRDNANFDWSLHSPEPGKLDPASARLAVLQDIRGELARIRKVLECPNATAIPAILRAIRQNTHRKRRAKK